MLGWLFRMLVGRFKVIPPIPPCQHHWVAQAKFLQCDKCGDVKKLPPAPPCEHKWARVSSCTISNSYNNDVGTDTLLQCEKCGEMDTYQQRI